MYKTLRATLIHLSIAIFSFIFGSFITVGLLSKSITINLNANEMEELFLGARVLLIVSILALDLSKVLILLDEWKEKNKTAATIIKLLFIILVPSFIIYEVGTVFLYGFFEKAIFPSLFLNIFNLPI